MGLNLSLLRSTSLSLLKVSRWPAGAPGGKGGQFAPLNGGGGGGGFKAPQYGLAKPLSSGGYFSSLFGSSEPAKPPAGSKPHPHVNDKGDPVTINYPTKASPETTWTNPNHVATFTPGGKAPETLNGVAMKPWKAPSSIEGWSKVAGQKPALDADLPFEPVAGKSVGAGVLIMEKDGRVWLTKPTNEFGGYRHTFPKGTVEDGLSLQASAIKEAYEETGLKVKITGVLGDYERSTSKARFYIAERVGGTPVDMGWESQAIRLTPVKRLKELLNRDVDKNIADDFLFEAGVRKGFSLFKSSMRKTLYVCRKLLNADELIAWAKANGFETTVPAEEMHVTIAYSKAPVDWLALTDDYSPETIEIIEGGPRSIEALGKNGEAVALVFGSQRLEWRWQAIREAGASWDFESYTPHVTISWNAANVDLDNIEPYTGKLEFGPELFKEIDTDLRDNLVEKEAKGGKGKGSFNVNQPRWPAGSPLGGQWMKIGLNGIIEPPTLAGGLTGKNSAYQKKANALYALASAGSLTGLMDVLVPLNKKVAADKAAGKSSSHVKWNAQLAQYGEKIFSDLLHGPKAEAAAASITGPTKLSSMPKVAGKPGGSNPGAIHSEGGAKWLVKGNLQLTTGKVDQATSDDRAKNEVLSAKLIAAAGYGVPEMKLVDLEGNYGGGLGVASKMIDGVKGFDPSNAAHVGAIQKQFAVHAWLANYDVLGMGFDNTVLKDGEAINIDPGGAILFRAQGLNKTDFGPKANEWDTMRTTTGEQKAVFGKMTASQLQESAKALANIDDETIKKLVKSYGPGDAKAKDALAATLISRRDDILDKAGLKATPIKDAAPLKEVEPVAPPAPPKITDQPVANVDASALPAKPVFNSGLSSDKFYSKTADQAAALHAAGDLAGLKAMVKEAQVKTWGGKTANSKKLVGYHAALVADLEKQAGAQNAAIAAGTKPLVDDKGNAWKAQDGVLNPAPENLNASKIVEGLNVKAASKIVFAEYKNGVGAETDYLSELTVAAVKGDLQTAIAFVPQNEKQANVKSKLLAAMGYTGPETQAPGAPALKPVFLNHKQTKSIFEDVIGPNQYNFTTSDYNDVGSIEAFQQAVLIAMNGGSLPQTRAPSPPPAPAPAPKTPLPNFEAAKLPDTNVNAPSHNAKVELISKLAAEGKESESLALNFGVNTYGKKQAQLANDVLSSFGSPHKVTPGQKANSHPALVGGSSQLNTSPPPAPVTPNVKGPKPQLKDMPASALPPAPDIMNWNGSGKPYSSKEWKNKANQDALNAIYNAGLSGGPEAIDALKFPELNPDTGEATGKMITADEHPAKKVIGAYSADVKAAIHDFLHPPRPLAAFNIVNATSVQEAASKFFSAPIFKTVDSAPKDQQFGFWMALGKVAETKHIAPAKVANITPAQKSSGAQAYKGYSSNTLAWISNVQSSGKINRAYDKGETKYGDLDLKAVAKSLYKDATPLPEGARLHRWQHMPKGMLKQLESAPEGMVFQSGGGFCTSIHPTSTSHFGPHKVNIIAAPGAKAIHSHGSGGFASEQEITTLPGQRYVLMGKKKVGQNWEIDLLMLPPDPNYVK
jgi:ADP-ribose pyrophosphatase YjhB (NUDIX family)